METEKKDKEKGLLTLTRRFGESIVIGRDIKVIIVGIMGDKVRLCIEAPKDVSIWRSELLPEDGTIPPAHGSK